MRKKETKEKVIQALQKGRNIWDACIFADLSRQTFYNWVDKDKKFLAKVQFAKSNLERKSKDLIHELITEKKDISLAKRYLEKKSKETHDKDELLDPNDITLLFKDILEQEKKLFQDLKNKEI